MDYCANTFRSEPISRDGTQTTSRQSHTPSTPDRVSDSIGELPLKYGTNTYDQFNSNVLLRPVESALATVSVYASTQNDGITGLDPMGWTRLILVSDQGKREDLTR